MSLFTDAIARLRQWNLNPWSPSNPYGLTGTGATDANLEPLLGDIATACETTATNAQTVAVSTAAVTAARDDVLTRQADVTARHGVIVADAAQVAADRLAVAADKAAAHTDRLAADVDAAATAADRTAVAADKAAAHTDRLAADADAAATAADRTAVATDKAAVAADRSATHTDRLAADASAAAAAAAAAGVSLPAIVAGDAGKTLEVKADGTGWQLVAVLKAAGGTLTGWLQAFAGTDASNLGLRIGEATSGFYRSAAGVVGFVAAGVEVFRTAATGTLTFLKAVRGGVVPLAYASTITPDFAAGNYFKVTLTGNPTLGTPSNLAEGQGGSIFFTQDAAGNRSLSFAAGWKFEGAVVPSLSTSAGVTDRLDYLVFSPTVIQARLAKGAS